MTPWTPPHRGALPLRTAALRLSLPGAGFARLPPCWGPTVRVAPSGNYPDTGGLREVIYECAVQRLRPTTMTTTVNIAGLLSIMWSTGAGADVMKRIAVPMVGGVVIVIVVGLLVYPAIYFLWRGRALPA